MADYILDEQTKEALLGLMPFTQTATIPFTPPVYKLAFEKSGGNMDLLPVITQRSFTKEEKDAAKQLLKDASKNKGNIDKEKAKELARKTIKGWQNFVLLPECTLLEFEPDADGSLAPEIMSKLHEQVAEQIFMNAFKISSLASFEYLGLMS